MAWSNQTLAMVVLWAITAFIVKEKKFYWVSLIPAIFMTAVTTTYILIAPEGFQLNKQISYVAGLNITVIISTIFFVYV